MSGAIATEPEDKPTKKLPVPAPRSRTSLSSPTSIGEESLVEGNDETKSSSSLSEYSKCSFRFDINVIQINLQVLTDSNSKEGVFEVTLEKAKEKTRKKLKNHQKPPSYY